MEAQSKPKTVEDFKKLLLPPEEITDFVRIPKFPWEKSFVAWVDIMGTRNMMNISPTIATTQILKFHTAMIQMQEDAQKNYDASVSFFPMVDGIYIVTKEFEPLMAILCRIFEKCKEILIKDFLEAESKKEQKAQLLNPQEKPDMHGFIPKCAVAYGSVLTGEKIPKEIGYQFFDKDNVLKPYAKSLISGLPIIQAFAVEKETPPFGIFLHDTVTSELTPEDLYSDQQKPERPLRYWYPWLKNDKNADEKTEERMKFEKALQAYFQHAFKHSISYDVSRINDHIRKVNAYFNFDISLTKPNQPTTLTQK